MKGRLSRLMGMVKTYVLSWHGLLFAAVAIGLLVAVATNSWWLQIVSIGLTVAALSILMAQLNYRVGTSSRAPQESGRGAAVLPSEQHEPEDDGKWEMPRGIGMLPPIATLIVPGKNEAPYVADCISSIKRQTLENFEVVVIDDGSTDSTLDELLRCIDGDSRFRVLRSQESIGPGLARNLGAESATTKYITFLDLDDFLAPDSLEKRVAAAEREADLPWVAGVYCWYELVTPSSTPDNWVPSGRGRRGHVSWLGHHDDNVFIVSAPLLRRDAFLAVGGFDDAPTAEDPMLWFKMMRCGFTFTGTGQIGVAYRQKPSSRAVSTAVAMRDAMAAILAARSKSAPQPAKHVGPFFYSDGLEEYRAAAGFVRRTASALGLAIASNATESTVSGLTADLVGSPYSLVGWEVGIVEMAKTAARRLAQASTGRARDPVTERAIDRLLGPLVGAARAKGAQWMSGVPSAGSLNGNLGGVHRVREPRLIGADHRSMRVYTESGRPFLLLPSAAYHTDELIELVPELRRRGFAPVAMLDDFRWTTTGSALARVDVPAIRALPEGDWLDEFVGLLTFNDWGEYYSKYVRFVADRGCVSFAKVEGVQDWHDEDTARVRNAYLTASVVLCQGDNDVDALRDRRDRTEVVGSDRLERIWHQALPHVSPPRAVANVNFTYDVLAEHRDLWVETVREACGRASVPLELSVHPSETASYPHLTANAPIRHLLIEDSILISRFSTVLYEGMARGCSVIYYNPHGEKVPTFKNPQGAFEVAEGAAELATAIEKAKGVSRHESKDRATEFFARQVSMTPDRSAAIRTADVIERYIAH